MTDALPLPQVRHALGIERCANGFLVSYVNDHGQGERRVFLTKEQLIAFVDEYWRDVK